MSDAERVDTIATLRKQARFCRAQARLSVLPGAAAAFEHMAKTIDADADELEAERALTRPGKILWQR